MICNKNYKYSHFNPEILLSGFYPPYLLAKVPENEHTQMLTVAWSVIAVDWKQNFIGTGDIYYDIAIQWNPSQLKAK